MSKSSTWKTLAGAGVLVVRDGSVLMVHRARSGANRWELSSGLNEGHEPLEETARREALEETGLDIEVGRLLCTVVMDVPDEHYRAVNLYYAARTQSNAEPHIKNCNDEPIDDVRFVDLAKVRPIYLHPVDRKILSLWKRRPDREPYYVHITL